MAGIGVAVINIGFTKGAFKARGASTSHGVIVFTARPVVVTRIGVTAIHICLTVIAGVPVRAGTSIAVDSIHAFAPVEAGGTGAIVHIRLAIGACKPSGTSAGITVHTVGANPSI